MTDIDIDAIRQREQAATPGPWHPHTTYPHTVWQGSQYDDDPGMISTSLAQEVVADAVFVAHARTDVPALLAKVAELTAAQDRAAKRIDGLRDYILGTLDEDDTLAPDEMRNASIDLADALADLGHPVADEDEAPRRSVVTVELPAEAVAR